MPGTGLFQIVFPVLASILTQNTTRLGIDEVVAAENQAVDRRRHYEIGPREYLEAMKRCRGTPASRSA